MEQEHKSVKEMWDNYNKSIGADTSSLDGNYTSWYFCNDEKNADDLAELVKQGIKRATTSLHYFYEAEDEALPEAGDLSIITDWQGTAQCMIEMKRITILPFKEVSKEFAKTEGEGDQSLKYWQDVHRDVYTRELKELGREFKEDMLVVCQEFDVVYP